MFSIKITQNYYIFSFDFRVIHRPHQITDTAGRHRFRLQEDSALMIPTVTAKLRHQVGCRYQIIKYEVSCHVRYALLLFYYNLCVVALILINFDQSFMAQQLYFFTRSSDFQIFNSSKIDIDSPVIIT